MSAYKLPQEDENVVTLDFIIARLGRRDYGARRRAGYVNALIDGWQFPPPYPYHRIVNGRTILTCAASSKARWDKTAVLSWLEDYLPPDNAAAVDNHAMRAAAAKMEQRAQSLRLVGGTAA